MKAVLKGWLYIPLEAVRDVGELQEMLTYTPRPGMDGERRDPVHMFTMEREGYVGVPQAWGRVVFEDITVTDLTTTGAGDWTAPRLPDPNHPSVRDPDAQERFMIDMIAAANDHRTFNAVAPTGTGKTVVGLRTAALLGHKTLVLVHLKTIRDQWVDSAVNLLGLPRERVGIVEGGTAQWRDRDVVCGMLQSVAFNPGRYGEEFYEAFGTVIFDEVHRAGAPVFAQAVWQFPAKYRFGLSATAHRKDKGERVFFWHLGPVKVRSGQDAMPIQIWPLWYESGRHKLWGKEHGSRIKCLSQDDARNRRIAGLVKRMYDRGRNAIVVAEAVAHLETLMELSKQAGVPKEVMGQFTSQINYIEKVDMGGGHVQPVAKKRTQSRSALERIKQSSQIIFATYNMMKEGVDIPRLDAGIDATPRSDATQLIGRTRRPGEDKKTSVWVTIVDVNCERSLRYYRGRLKEYEACGAEVMAGVR